MQRKIKHVPREIVENVWNWDKKMNKWMSDFISIKLLKRLLELVFYSYSSILFVVYYLITYKFRI